MSYCSIWSNSSIRSLPCNKSTFRLGAKRADSSIQLVIRLVGAITSAGVTALIGCLQEVLERESGLVMHLRQPSGNEIEFNADNLDEAKRALAMSVSPPA